MLAKNVWAESYRPEIDGLRAFAVIAVLLYHAFPVVLQGGFVGVDVFFVISGYLITGIIIDSAGAGSYSISEFYAKRVRRIFPALLLVLFFSVVYGEFFLYPDEYKALASQVLAGGAFFSNFLFWSEVGYFDRASETKPLLHLWSLAVEEQFYIVWPLLVVWALGRGRNFLCWVLFCVTVLSFGVSLLMLLYDANGAYYAPWSRCWELSVGGVVAFFQRSSKVPLVGRASTFAGLIAALGLFFSVLFINKGNSFPGFWAIVPVLSAAVILASCGKGVVSKVLAHPLLVKVGLFSYPLYLWHWPIIVWIDLEFGAIHEVLRRSIAIVVSFLLAVVTWRVVEQPLRHAKGMAVSALTICMGAVLFWALVVWWRDGVSFSIDAESQSLRSGQIAELKWISNDVDCVRHFGLNGSDFDGQQVFCNLNSDINSVSVAILGDSTANSLYPGFASHGYSVLNIGNGTCPPFSNVSGKRLWNQKCEVINAKALDWVLRSSSVRLVILSWASWDGDNIVWSSGRTGVSAVEQDGQSALSDLVDRLVAAGKTVFLVFDTPKFPVLPEACFQRRRILVDKSCEFEDSELLSRAPWLDAWRRAAVKVAPQDACAYPISEFFRIGPSSMSPLSVKGEPLMRDTHHLSVRGSVLAVNDLLRYCGRSNALSH